MSKISLALLLNTIRDDVAHMIFRSALRSPTATLRVTSGAPVKGRKRFIESVVLFKALRLYDNN